MNLNTPRTSPKLFAVIFGIFLVWVAPAHFVKAESACDFAGKIQKVQDYISSGAIKLNTADSLAFQSALRKEALRAVIRCAQEDLQKHQDEVSGTDAAIPDMEGVKSQITQKLKEQQDYYQTRLKEIDDLGVRGTQEAAKSIRSWREAILSPALKAAENFIIWNNSQGLINASKTRLDQISKSFETLKLGNNKELLDLFVNARQKFESASEANERAKQLLLRLGPADYTEMLIKETLSDLSDSYKSLIALSEKAKENK